MDTQHCFEIYTSNICIQASFPIVVKSFSLPLHRGALRRPCGKLMGLYTDIFVLHFGQNM